MNKIRLDRLLANSGFGSRKNVKSHIRKGRILVDGQRVKDPGYIIDWDKSTVTIDGLPVTYKEFHYLMLNKPQGVVSATKDNLYETVIDLVPQRYDHLDLFPVGRLDRDTEGLLILTNDGQLAHKLLSPRRNVPKIYYAEVLGEVTEEDIAIFEKGIELEDGFTTLPAELNIIESSHTSKVEITICEGKFHQVKRMFEAVDKRVIYLKRIRMGGLALDDSLPLGKVRELTTEELDLLKNPL